MGSLPLQFSEAGEFTKTLSYSSQLCLAIRFHEATADNASCGSKVSGNLRLTFIFMGYVILIQAFLSLMFQYQSVSPARYYLDTQF